MRYALALKPSTEEAIERGCICKKGIVNTSCPIHFPLRYITKINNIEDYLEGILKFYNHTFTIIIVLLILNIISNFF